MGTSFNQKSGHSDAQPLGTEAAWQLILQAFERNDSTLAPASGAPEALQMHPHGGWTLLCPATDEARQMLSLFLPLCQTHAGQCQVLGQLGQSLDGRIATITGASRFINGDDGITHLHRLRAVSDAVVVGAGTASEDNPRLTVRRTEGLNPVRVVIDPRRRVPEGHHLFTDGQAPTLRLVSGTYEPGPKQAPETGVLELACLGEEGQQASPARVLEILSDFGLQRVFIEGGGLTVSSFLNAGLLDRLHVIVAPMIIGSGRPAFSLPEIETLDYALRPQAQLINLGSDMLFDLDFTEPAGA